MAVPKLIDALNQHPELRADIAIVLGNMGPAAAPATEALAKLVADDDSRVAVEATLALGKIGSEAKSAVPALSAALDRKECPNVHAIAFALGCIGPAALAAEPKLHHLAANKDRSLASVSAWAVTRLHPNSAEIAAKAIPIMEAALQEPLPETRSAAIEALASLGPLAKPAQTALEKMLHDEDPQVRATAAKALETIQGGASK
jgi:HEAT repeat protein